MSWSNRLERSFFGDHGPSACQVYSLSKETNLGFRSLQCRGADTAGARENSDALLLAEDRRSRRSISREANTKRKQAQNFSRRISRTLKNFHSPQIVQAANLFRRSKPHLFALWFIGGNSAGTGLPDRSQSLCAACAAGDSGNRFNRSLCRFYLSRNTPSCNQLAYVGIAQCPHSEMITPSNRFDGKSSPNQAQSVDCVVDVVDVLNSIVSGDANNQTGK